MSLPAGESSKMTLKAAVTVTERIAGDATGAVKQDGEAGTVHQIGIKVAVEGIIGSRRSCDVQHYADFRDRGNLAGKRPCIADAEQAVVWNREVRTVVCRVGDNSRHSRVSYDDNEEDEDAGQSRGYS